MKRLTTFLLLILVATSAMARKMTFEDLAAIRRIGAPKVSPDGKWIAFDASTIDLEANVRRSTIYMIPSTGGISRRLTDGKNQDEGPVWSPDGKMIAYVTNRDGGPKQVYLLQVKSGIIFKLTDLSSGASSVKWMPDGSGVLFVTDIYPECGVEPSCIKSKAEAAAKEPTKARVIDHLLYRHWNAWQEPTRSHIIYRPLKGKERDLTPGEFNAPPFSVGGGDEFDVSPDGREVVYAQDTERHHAELSTNSDLFIVPIGGGEATRITTRTGADTGPKYSPDGKWIAYRSQSRAGYESDLWELWLYDRAKRTSTRVASDFPNWINSVTWAPNSRSMYVTAPEKGTNVIYEIALDGKFTRLTTGGSADAVTVSADGKTLYYELSSLMRPNDIYSLSLSSRGAKSNRLTHDNDALFAGLELGATESKTWKGADGADVQGHLVRPPGFQASRKYPAIVMIHGGPQGAWSDAWSYRWNPQMFAARGYVVLMPNPRGSTGFGQKFIEEISQDWGGKVYTDIMNGVDMLTALPFVDGARLGAAGGSYGGYMVNWIAGHTDRFKALVSHAGLWNLEAFYGVTEELWFPEFEFGGTPWNNPEQYEKWSPHRFAKNIKTPILVTHGELDYRVPIGEGMALFTTLQRRGIPSKFLYFPDEGHWILKPQNSKLWHETVLRWFAQMLN